MVALSFLAATAVLLLPDRSRAAEVGKAGVIIDVAHVEAGNFLLTEVHPLLETRCCGCHGEQKGREAEFDTRTGQGLLKGGESGKPALVPGNPEKSRMFQAVLRQGKLKMPPKERNKLGAEEIEIPLRKWIAARARRGPPPPQAAKKSKPKWEHKPEDIWPFSRSYT